MKKKDKFTKLLLRDNKEKEKNWDDRYILDKIPQYDAFKDPNYLSLSLMKAKTKLEEKNNSKRKAENAKKRLFSSHYSINSKIKKTPSLSKINNEESYNEKNNNETQVYKTRPTSIYLKRNHLSFMNNINNSNSNIESNQNKRIFYNNNSNVKSQNTNKANIYINDVNDKLVSKTTKNKDINNIRNYIKYKDNSYDNFEKNNILQKDKNLIDELNEIKEIWKDICISSEYQNSFEEMIYNLNSKEVIQNMLNNEKNQIVQFKSDLSRLLNAISKRENTIIKIKKLDKIFMQNKNIVELNKIMNEKNKSAPNLESNDENNFDELEAKNKEEIENDINNCLKILRINSINVVHQFNKFRSINNYLFTSDKIEINKLKNKYGYNKEYLLKMKNDLDFLSSSNINQIYNFKTNDPFLLNLLPDKNKSEKNEKYKKIMASEELIKTINNSLFILAQEELLLKMKIKKELKKNKTEVLENAHKNNNIEFQNKNNYNEKKNINFVKLHSNKEYNKIFFQNNKKNINLDNNFNNNRIKKIKNLYFNNQLKNRNEDNKKNNEIPKTTAAQLQKKFDFYNKLKCDLTDGKEDLNEYKEKINEKIDKNEIENEKKGNNIIEKVKNQDEISQKNENEYENELTHNNKNDNNENEKDQNKNENKNTNKLNENKYKCFWYRDTFNKFKNLYKEYYPKLSKTIIDTFNINKNSNKFLNGINPKIIICQNEESKIYGLCGINYYDEQNKLILKINHLSSLDKDGDEEDNIFYQNKKIEFQIYDNFIELIKTLPYQIIELTLNINQQDNNILNYFIEKHKFVVENGKDKKEDKIKENNAGDEEKIVGIKILRLYNSDYDDEELNKLKEENEIKYSNASILSLGDYNSINNIKESKEDIIQFKINKYFYKYINTFNLCILLNSLTKNNIYKIENSPINNIPSSLEIVSKYTSIFVKEQNNCIDNISDIFPDCMLNTNNDEIKFSYFTSIFNFNLSPLISTIYNKTKYNVFQIKILEKNIYIIKSKDKNISYYIYQCDEKNKIKNEIQKNNPNFNIFEYFNKNLINNDLKNENRENKDKTDFNDGWVENETEEGKNLWVPSFSIDTQFICDKLPTIKNINILGEENKIFEIKEYNEILKISYGNKELNNNDFLFEPDLNNKKDIIIDNDFIFAVSHDDIKNQFNNSIIFLAYVSKDNFIYTN